MTRRVKLGFCLLGTALLAACGSPGIPLPPSLELAQPVTDLRAVRKGDKVYLTWTEPAQTTEKRNIRHYGPTQICRSAIEMRECGTPVAEVAPQHQAPNNAGAAKQASFIDQLSASAYSQAGSDLSYAVNVLNSYGKSAGLSNRAQVSAATTLPPPEDFQAQLSADGVRLTWKPILAPPVKAGLRYAFRIYRRELESGHDAVAGEVAVADSASPSFIDQSFEWEKTYDYRATVATTPANAADRQVEGEDSPPVRVVAHDIFPPAVPSGLQAVFSGPGQQPFIDLVWAPDTDSDLAGYEIYRREEGTQPTRVNSEPVKAPAFRDSPVLSGHKYFYSVSAIDVRGNESAKSEEASETVP